MKKYNKDTQKGKVIRSILIRGADEWYEDFDLEKTWNIFIWNSVWSRLSELKEEWILDIEYYPNPAKFWYKRARYRLNKDCIWFYKNLYTTNIIDKLTKWLT